MAGGPQAAALELMRPILDYFIHRDERNAAKEAATLRFWRDGMVSQLTAIAEGRATKETYTKLTENFDETEKPVQQAMWALQRIRKKLGLSKLAKQIDLVTSDEQVGAKAFIRRKIKGILGGYEYKDGDWPDPKRDARDILQNIEYLNGELDRLYRMVYD